MPANEGINMRIKSYLGYFLWEIFHGRLYLEDHCLLFVYYYQKLLIYIKINEVKSIATAFSDSLKIKGAFCREYPRFLKYV